MPPTRRGPIHPSLSWFVPNMNLGALSGGILLALFIYWGWDTAVSVNEETENKSVVPGVAAILSTLGLVFIYVVATTASQAFHGPAYLTNNSGDILSALGSAVLGSTLDKLLIAVVLTSATASTLTTILPGARTTLSMASHGAIPKIFAKVNPRFQTPVWGTVIYGIVSIVWYAGLTLLSQNVLADSIAALGLTIAFYYGINGFAVPLFYRHQVFKSFKKFFMPGRLPASRRPHPGLGVRRLARPALVPGQLGLRHLLVRGGSSLRPRRGLHPRRRRRDVPRVLVR